MEEVRQRERWRGDDANGTSNGVRVSKITDEPGGDGGSPTRDLGVRSASLYASELRPRIGSIFIIAAKRRAIAANRPVLAVRFLFYDRVVLSGSPPNFSTLFRKQG